jgi:hypothetical protein
MMGLPGLGKLEAELPEMKESLRAMRQDITAMRLSLERLVEIEEERLALERGDWRSKERANVRRLKRVEP